MEALIRIKSEAGRIAANIAKLRKLQSRRQTWGRTMRRGGFLPKLELLRKAIAAL